VRRGRANSRGGADRFSIISTERPTIPGYELLGLLAPLHRLGSPIGALAIWASVLQVDNPRTTPSPLDKQGGAQGSARSLR
jgi:hypothetical protein